LHRSVKKTPKVWGGGVLFFWGARLLGAVRDREWKPGHKWGGLVLKAAENMPEAGWRYKKRREIPPFLLFFAVF